ncbi:MAG: DUF3822 family protein [Flavobacterium sp.]|nr:DUF3822 family protein [Pedobacter sp.]
MTYNPIVFKDKNFQSHEISNCHLLIRFNSNSYSYIIIDQSQNEVIAVGKFTLNSNFTNSNVFEQFQNFCKENEDLNLSFGKVKISLETHSFTFIPDDLFFKGDLQDYSKFMVCKPDDIILDRKLSLPGIHNIILLGSEHIKLLKNTFHEPLIFSQVEPFIAAAFKLVENGSHAELFLNFNSESFEAAVIKNQNLQFYNIFSIAGADDFNYFLLNVLTHLDPDTKQLVCISGEINQNMELYFRLAKYFDHISFADAGNIVDTSKLPEEIHSHLYFSVSGLNLCE